MKKYKVAVSSGVSLVSGQPFPKGIETVLDYVSRWNWGNASSEIQLNVSGKKTTKTYGTHILSLKRHKIHLYTFKIEQEKHNLLSILVHELRHAYWALTKVDVSEDAYNLVRYYLRHSSNSYLAQVDEFDCRVEESLFSLIHGYPIKQSIIYYLKHHNFPLLSDTAMLKLYARKINDYKIPLNIELVEHKIRQLRQSNPNDGY